MPAFISLQQYREYICPVWLADTNGILPLTVPVYTDGFKNASGKRKQPALLEAPYIGDKIKQGKVFSSFSPAQLENLSTI